MSKIIQALEKAKKEGDLDQVAAAIEERDTLAPVAQRKTQEVQRNQPRKRNDHHTLSLRQLDPEVLRGVDPHIEALHKPMSVVAEQYRAIRSRIERLNFEGKLKTIAVSSAGKGDGKSVTATNLAVILAQDATKRVLLIDADLRRPKIHQLLNLEQSPGLAEHIEGGDDDAGVIQTTPYFGLFVVTAGRALGHPGEILASPEFEDFVADCRKQFDYVIFDTPPLHPISDVSFLTERVDGIILVVRSNKTAKGLLRQAAENVPSNKIIGTLLNRAVSLSSGYGYKKGYYYYKYY